MHCQPVQCTHPPPPVPSFLLAIGACRAVWVPGQDMAMPHLRQVPARCSLKVALHHTYITLPQAASHITGLQTRLNLDQVGKTEVFESRKKKRMHRIHFQSLTLNLTLALTVTLTVKLSPNHLATRNCWRRWCTVLPLMHQPTLQCMDINYMM